MAAMCIWILNEKVRQAGYGIGKSINNVSAYLNSLVNLAEKDELQLAKAVFSLLDKQKKYGMYGLKAPAINPLKDEPLQ